MTIGKAYAFFDCSASSGAIEAELLTIRPLAQTPSELELVLSEGGERAKSDKRLSSFIEEMRMTNLRYALEATFPKATNEAAADELASIINQMYQTELYQQGEHFRGEIVYESEGEYTLRE